MVRPNALRNMRDVYAGLPEVRVEPLHFAPEDISGERLLAMMKVEQEQRRHLSHSFFCVISPQIDI